MNPLELERVITDSLKLGATLGLGLRSKDVSYEIQTYGTTIIKKFEENMNANEEEKEELQKRLLVIISQATEYRWITLFKNRSLLNEQERNIIGDYAIQFAATVLLSLQEEAIRKHLKEVCERFDRINNLKEIELDDEKIKERIQKFKTSYQSYRQLGRKKVLEGQHLLQLYRLLHPVLCLEHLERYLATVKGKEKCKSTDDILKYEDVSITIEHLRTWTPINDRISVFMRHSDECKHKNREIRITKEYGDRQVTIYACGNAYTTMTPVIIPEAIQTSICHKYLTWSIKTLDKFNDSGRLYLTIKENEITGANNPLLSQLTNGEKCIIIQMNIKCELKFRYEHSETANLFMLIEDEFNEAKEEVKSRLTALKDEDNLLSELTELFMTSKEAINYQRLQNDIADELSTGNARKFNEEILAAESSDADDEFDSDYTRVDEL